MTFFLNFNFDVKLHEKTCNFFKKITHVMGLNSMIAPTHDDG